jgi:hypothetical protein
MDYLTKYYINLSEQLQERINILEGKLKKINYVPAGILKSSGGDADEEDRYVEDLPIDDFSDFDVEDIIKEPIRKTRQIPDFILLAKEKNAPIGYVPPYGYGDPNLKN